MVGAHRRELGIGRAEEEGGPFAVPAGRRERREALEDPGQVFASASVSREPQPFAEMPLGD
ncbi:MAG TPA: hypothetical protein VM451_04770 [Candidatus Limnocylindria bacterium]|nr:hypothetical protein [Candidatus Limnocylindria bacterium]